MSEDETMARPMPDAADAHEGGATELAGGAHAVELDALRSQLAAAEENERRRIARELHDEVGQRLSAIALGLKALATIAPPGSDVDRRAQKLQAQVNALGEELHTIAVRLRPRALDDYGLEAALRAAVAMWAKESGVQIDLHVRLGGSRLPDGVESNVFRIAQEVLTNIARHSGAKHASVVLDRRREQLTLVIEDDGCGFDSAAAGVESTRLGLVGVRERAALLNGTTEIESSVGSGTTVFVRIPLSNGAPVESQHGG